MVNEARAASGAVRSRLVTFGGATICVDSVGEVATRIVDLALGALPSAGGPDAHRTLRVDASDDGTTLTLDGDDGGPAEHGSPAVIASALLERATVHLSDRSQEGVLIHAAAVSIGGRCLLLPGQSGAGKSTLTAWLVSKGFTYLTDELVYIPAGSREIRSFPRPLNVKTAGLSALDGVVSNVARLSPHLLSGPRVTLVPASLLKSPSASRAGELAGIAFPRFLQDASLDIAPLSKAQLGLALMGCLVNARNLEGHGFSQVVALAGAVPACRLTYGGFDQLGDWVEHVIASGGRDIVSTRQQEGQTLRRAP